MLQQHVTAKGTCTYCGAALKKCLECSEPFHATNKNHVRCSPKCRMRHCRKEKLKNAPT